MTVLSAMGVIPSYYDLSDRSGCFGQEQITHSDALRQNQNLFLGGSEIDLET